MNEAKKKILRMVADGKISVEEGDELIGAIEESASPGEKGASAGTGPSTAPEVVTEVGRPAPKYLRVDVQSGENESVNIRIPLALIRAGAKLGSNVIPGMIPAEARERISQKMSAHGVQFDLGNMMNLDAKSLDALIDGLRDFTINVDDGADHVHIFCE